MEYAIWIAFFVIIGGCLALDLGLHRKPSIPTIGEALNWTLLWVLLSIVFNVCVYFLYEHHSGNGKEAALQFFTGYLIEKSLSLDNVFVIALIFSYFQVPLAYQHRTLSLGILGAILMRLIMITVGTALVLKFNWILYVFGILLIYSAIKMLVETPRTFNPENSFIIRLARRIIPVTNTYDGHHFFTKENGKRAATPLFIALLQIEACDLLFAIDSIPAIFAVTLDPFIIFTSNICAILGLRALYFALAGLLGKFRYLKVSLVLILLFVGIKMLLAHFYPIPLVFSLAVIIGLLVGGALFSHYAPVREKDQPPGPLTQDIQEIATLTWNQGKRLVILIFGITILIIGLAMIVLPGPAIVFIPLGLAILAQECVWAKKLLARLKEKGSKFLGK